MSDIEKVKQNSEIVEIISRYIDLQKAGSNYKAVCPFHNEKSPSFMVNPNMQIYKCFGCGNSGDVITFIQEYEHLDFRESLERLADFAGITLENKISGDDSKIKKLKKRIIEANTLASKFYHHILMSHATGKKAREYAEKRHLDGKTLKRFQFGYAPDGYNNLIKYLEKHGFNSKELEEFGLAVERNGKFIDKFRNRLMQPVFDVQDNIVGFSGRYLGDFENAPKYLNTSETLVFKKNQVLYGLNFAANQIRNQKFVILVEGNIDVVSSARVGVENIVAPLGTSFTVNQAKLVKRYTTEVYLAFDNDSAGIKAIPRAIEYLEQEDITHKVIDLEKFKDVDDLISANPSEWQKYIDGAVETLDYLAKKYSADLDLGSAAGKNKFKNLIVPVLKIIKNKITYNHFLEQFSILLNISKDQLQEEIDGTGKVNFREIESNEKTSTYKDEYKTEKLLISLLIDNYKSNVEILEERIDILKNWEFYPVLDVIVKAEGSDLNLDSIELVENHKEILKDSMMVDLTEMENPQKIFGELVKRVSKSITDARILQIREELRFSGENEDLINELNNLIARER